MVHQRRPDVHNIGCPKDRGTPRKPVTSRFCFGGLLFACWFDVVSLYWVEVCFLVGDCLFPLEISDLGSCVCVCVLGIMCVCVRVCCDPETLVQRRNSSASPKSIGEGAGSLLG